MLLLQENTWAIENLVTVTITAIVTIGTTVIVIATIATGTTAGVIGTVIVILTAGTVEIGATAEAHLADTHLTIVDAEAIPAVLQEAAVRHATVTSMRPRHRMALEIALVGRRYHFACFTALGLVVQVSYGGVTGKTCKHQGSNLFNQRSEALTPVSFKNLCFNYNCLLASFLSSSSILLFASTSFPDVPQPYTYAKPAFISLTWKDNKVKAMKTAEDYGKRSAPK